MKEKNLYRMRVYPVETNANTIEWAAELPDLPGCVGAGDTAEEAVAMAMDAKKAWVRTAMEEGREIPKPKNIDEDNFSGKFTLRLPKTLHKELTLQAEEEGVSLNQYLLYLITKGLNKKEEISAKYELKDKIDFLLRRSILSNLNWKAEEYSIVKPCEELLTQKS
jgi:antitoxin HicB